MTTDKIGKVKKKTHFQFVSVHFSDTNENQMKFKKGRQVGKGIRVPQSEENRSRVQETTNFVLPSIKGVILSGIQLVNLQGSTARL
jgi:hypothetical protein